MPRRILVGPDDVLIYKKLELDADVLDAITSADKRLLWAFVRGSGNDVRAVPYSEDRVIWLAEEDVATPDEVEL